MERIPVDVLICPCQEKCRKGRHESACPNSRAGNASRSGPSGRGVQPRSNVDSSKLATLRTLLELPDDATPNAILDATIENLAPNTHQQK